MRGYGMRRRKQEYRHSGVSYTPGETLHDSPVHAPRGAPSQRAATERAHRFVHRLVVELTARAESLQPLNDTEP